MQLSMKMSMGIVAVTAMFLLMPTTGKAARSVVADKIIQAIAVDSGRGEWFGTSGDGVSHRSADNVTWTTYTYANTGGELVDDTILAIAIDNYAGKWFGTPRGVSYLTLNNFTWETFTKENTPDDGLPDNYVSAIAVDPYLGGGVVWHLFRRELSR